MTPEYLQLKRVLIERTGLAYYEDKDRDLLDIVGRRVQATGKAPLRTMPPG